MEFNYGLLKEKIRDEYGSCKKFAATIGIDNSMLSLKLNNKSLWTGEQIYKAAKLLGIEGQIELFFFTPKFDKSKGGK